jgi:hypothetical protein
MILLVMPPYIGRFHDRAIEILRWFEGYTMAERVIW